MTNSDRFVIFTKPRVRDHDGQIYAMAWDRALEFITKGTGRTTRMANAAAIQAAAAMMDDYVIVTVSGKVVTSYRAKSQDMRSMDKPTFQASKDAVLGILAEMIGVDPATLNRQSEAA